MSKKQVKPNNDTSLVSLFAKQKKIYPKRVWGKYRKLKWLVMILTLGVYYLTPFIRWDRGLYAPDQAVLIDLPSRRAYFFWIEIWPQEVYYLTGILILAAIALFFVTSLFGRVWCGYFCPQTVWTDLYVWVERIVQGDRNQRRKLQEGPWTAEKFAKLSITHFVWVIIGLVTGGAYVFYFNDAPTLLNNIIHLNVSSTVLWFVFGLTFSTYLMAGFAREQVCTYMCPYARFQSAMFDKDTLIIGYDTSRGEPRGSHKKGDSWDGRGDCIDCSACVQVCPVGIDIREGLQMECIACGLCVDACNNIMDKIERPRGLVRYDTTNHMKAKIKGGKEKFHILRPRFFYYSTVMAIVCVIMLVALLSRAAMELHVIHDRNPVFVQLSSGEIRNGYILKILNKTYEKKSYTLGIEGIDSAVIDVISVDDISQENLLVEPSSVSTYHITIKAEIEPGPNRDIILSIIDNKTGEVDKYSTIFVSRRG